MKQSPEPPSEQPDSTKKSWLYNLLLTVVVTANIPMYSILLCLCLFFFTLYYYLTPYIWMRTALLMYLLYCVLDSTPQSSYPPKIASLRSWTRKNWFIQKCSEYFPCHLHKTTDLDPTKRYIFLYHPHGVICMGANIALSSEGCDFANVFPGVSSYIFSGDMMMVFMRKE